MSAASASGGPPGAGGGSGAAHEHETVDPAGSGSPEDAMCYNCTHKPAVPNCTNGLCDECCTTGDCQAHRTTRSAPQQQEGDEDDDATMPTIDASFINSFLEVLPPPLTRMTLPANARILDSGDEAFPFCPISLLYHHLSNKDVIIPFSSRIDTWLHTKGIMFRRDAEEIRLCKMAVVNTLRNPLIRLAPDLFTPIITPPIRRLHALIEIRTSHGQAGMMAYTSKLTASSMPHGTIGAVMAATAAGNASRARRAREEDDGPSENGAGGGGGGGGFSKRRRGRGGGQTAMIQAIAAAFGNRSNNGNPFSGGGGRGGGAAGGRGGNKPSSAASALASLLGNNSGKGTGFSFGGSGGSSGGSSGGGSSSSGNGQGSGGGNPTCQVQ